MFNGLFFLVFIFIRGIHGLTQDYCNSALPSDAESTSSSNYMSNGLCMSQCQGYKYAIVQQKDCWCSDETPQDIVSVSNCDEYCPGYKLENCGSGTTYYGWLKVANDYIAGASATSFSYASLTEETSSFDDFTSSTEFSSSTTSSTSASSTSSSEFSSSSSESFSSSSESSSSSSESSSSSSESSSSSSESSTSSSESFTTTESSPSKSSSTVQKTVDSSASSSSEPSTLNQVTITSVAVTTIMPSTHTTSDSNGSEITSAAAQSVQSIYKTIVVSTTVLPSSSNTATKSGSKSKGFWQSKGKVAGTFVVVALAILLLIVLCVFFFVVKPRRESKKQDEFEKTYNEIIQSNLRDSVENDAKVSSGTLAVNNALKGFQEFESDRSSSIEHKNMFSPETQDPPNFIPDYDMLSEDDQGSGFDVYTQDNDDELVPRRHSLGALKVVNMSTATVEQVKKD